MTWFEVGVLFLLTMIAWGIATIERAILKVGRLLDERLPPRR